MLNEHLSGNRNIIAPITAIGTAGNDGASIVFVAPFACELVTAYYSSPTAVAAHATDGRSMQLINKGTAGSGSTAMNTAKTTLSGGGGAITAYDEWELGAIITTANAHRMAAGDVIALVDTHAGSGQVTGVGSLRIVYKAI